MPSLFSKTILALTFFYLVAMMVVLGNGSSFLGRSLGHLFIPVANTIGLNTTWNFFSPDPAHTMYLKYYVHFEDEYANAEYETVAAEFPPESQTSDFRVHVRRMSYVMRFLAASPERIQRYFVPWICRQYPKATRIQVEVLVNRIPSLEVASTLRDTNYSDLIKSEEINQNAYPCKL